MKNTTQETMSREICRREKKIPHMPLNVLFNILTRLSLRVVSSFKCVCKQWQSFIQARIIPKTHIIVRRQYLFAYNAHTEFYTIDKDGTATSFFYEFTKNHAVQKIASCNGLLCLALKDGNLQLCNPTRKETTILPKPGCLLNKEHHRKKVSIEFGFGFDSTMERYKIVVWDPVEKLEPEIITLGTKSSWRSINNQKQYPPSYYYPTCSAIYIEGASYWSNVTNQILSFCFRREEYGVISTPRDVPHFTDLHEIRGRLCVVEKTTTHDSLLTMWVLEDHDKGLWVKEVIDFQSNIPIQLVMAVQGSEILMQTEKNKNTEELVLYRCNDENEVIAGIKVQGLPFTPDYECKYLFHRESLVSLQSLALESYQQQ